MGFLSNLFGGKKEVPRSAPEPANSSASSKQWQDAGGVPQELAATEVLDLFNSTSRPVFLDVREPEERVESGFIPGSVHIPMHEIQGRLDELNTGDSIIVYCATGMRSMDAGAFLLQQGFKDVSNLNGGLAKWSGPLDGRN